MPELLSVEAIAQIEARALRATAGPWKSYIEGRDHTSGSTFIKTPGPDFEISGASAADHDFIAEARQDIPLLIGEIRRLRALISN